jgi:hypothetical protein
LKDMYYKKQRQVKYWKLVKVRKYSHNPDKTPKKIYRLMQEEYVNVSNIDYRGVLKTLAKKNLF